jgi:chromosome partitioning protein
MIRVVFNQKGGVGKSSITTNLAAVSAAHGYRTLLLDLDSQCNTTQYVLGTGAEDPETSICQFFQQTLGFKSQRRKPADYVQQTAFENLFIVPGHPELADIQAKLESRHKIYKLRDLLQDLSEEFDRIYVDTPPAFNFYSLSALIAADKVLIPFDCDDFSRKALYTLIENLKETQSDHNEDLTLEGIVVNQYQHRASQPRRIVDELIAEGHPIFKSFLGSSVKMRESHETAEPLIYGSIAHKLTQQFIALFEEMEGVAIDQEQLAIAVAEEEVT